MEFANYICVSVNANNCELSIDNSEFANSEKKTGIANFKYMNCTYYHGFRL